MMADKLKNLLDYTPREPGLLGALLDSQFYADIGNRLSGLLSSGVQDVFPLQSYLNVYNRARAGEKNVLSTEWQNNPQMRDAVLNTALGALTVYHGSPHKFDRFDMSKIGTGEGAQAYGHGLYMAESPGVAKSYQMDLSAPQWNLHDVVAQLPEKYRGSRDNARSIYEQISDAVTTGQAKSGKEFISTFDISPELLPAYRKAAEFVDSSGHMYKADIPDEAVARMLDWDKPLSQQHPDVQKIIGAMMQDETSPIGSAMKHYTFTPEEMQQATGRLLYDFMGGGNIRNYAKSAERLKELGIPGIKYADAMSRGKDAGTSNYVLFSDELPRILERNGEPTGLLPWKPGEWK